MIRKIIAASILIAPVASSSANPREAIEAASEETVAASNLRFDPCPIYSLGSLNTLAAGHQIGLDRRFLVTVPNLRRLLERVKDENVKHAIVEIIRNMDQPLSKTMQYSLKILHQFLVEKWPDHFRISTTNRL
jgi:hypothetical protein